MLLTTIGTFDCTVPLSRQAIMGRYEDTIKFARSLWSNGSRQDRKERFKTIEGTCDYILYSFALFLSGSGRYRKMSIETLLTHLRDIRAGVIRLNILTQSNRSADVVIAIDAIRHEIDIIEIILNDCIEPIRHFDENVMAHRTDVIGDMLAGIMDLEYKPLITSWGGFRD